ncbi:MAG: ATP-grasp domain-containing protein, partial [Planctomycetota bacterium]|nr:ATP-grasp domain-containing protein [Planctomycetota bacterium]
VYREQPRTVVILGAEHLPYEAPVIVLASHPLIQHIQKTRRWTPGPWCNQDKLECSSYYAFFGPYLLNQNYTLLPGVEAIRHKERLFKNPGNGEEVFIRPSSVEKIFTGKLATRASFKGDLAATLYNPRTLVLLAEPQGIKREWRAVIANGHVIAVSQYIDAGGLAVQRGAPDEVIRFIEKVLSTVTWRPDPLFIMDICESGDKLHILEINSFSGSGFYQCDFDALVEAATRCAQNYY